MKKHIVTLVFVCSVLGLQAQNRKHVANFSLFQQYFNPALTGYEGSMVKTFHRNQWTGFEDAPKTIFVSGELDVADLAGWKNTDLVKTRHEDGYNRQLGGRHAFGVVVLNDRFGPFTENQIHLSYGSRVRLTETMSLRMGGALTYSGQRLDGSRLTIDQENDPEFQDVLGRRSGVNKFDLNLGLMLTADAFYVGYAMQDVTNGKMMTSGDGHFTDMFPRTHVAQAGYRKAVTEQFGMVANGIYQYNSRLRETIEGQLKGVYQNTAWLGAGYRHNLAYNLTAGIRLNQLKIAYVYETPIRDAIYLNKATNEISLTYNLFQMKYPKFSNQVSMW